MLHRNISMLVMVRRCRRVVELGATSIGRACRSGCRPEQSQQLPQRWDRDNRSDRDPLRVAAVPALRRDGRQVVDEVLARIRPTREENVPFCGIRSVGLGAELAAGSTSAAAARCACSRSRRDTELAPAAAAGHPARCSRSRPARSRTRTARSRPLRTGQPGPVSLTSPTTEQPRPQIIGSLAATAAIRCIR